MSESTGRITFINSHDYISDVTGTEVIGCLASLMPEDGKAVDVYTQSLRLQHTLEMAYATQRKVTVDYAEKQVDLTERRRSATGSTPDRDTDQFEGPFRLQALWTLE